MSDVTRRVFVSGLLVSAPAAALAGLQPAAPSSDPVWGLIMSDLQRIYGELKADPSRRDSLRALESTIRTHAAYSASLGNPQRLQRAVAAQLRGRRAEFLDDARRMAGRDHRYAEMRSVLPNFEGRPSRRADPDASEFEPVAVAVSRQGHLPGLLAAANLARVLAEQRPQLARVRFEEAQWDLCAQMEAEIAALMFLTGIVCAMTIVNPALAPECAALGATLAVMEMAYFIFCTWL